MLEDAGARAGPRRAHLRRGHGLRRHLGRARHGRPLGRGRRARHAPRPAHAAAGTPGQLHQRPRHLDARWATSARSRRCAASSATDHPPISSTKSMTGHSQGATGAQEAIYCLLMLRDDFIAPSINVENLDPALQAGRDRHRDGRGRGARHRDDELLRVRRHERLDAAVSAAGWLTCWPAGAASIMGVANDHSIAWGIARALAAEGAALAFTYQGEAFGRRVEPLAASVGSDILVDVDVHGRGQAGRRLRPARRRAGAGSTSSSTPSPSPTRTSSRAGSSTPAARTSEPRCRSPATR